MAEDWAKKLTRWPPHVDGAATYDLTHVHPFAFQVEMAATKKYTAKSITVRVVFSHHTFTRSIKIEDAGMPPYAARSDDPRMFCTERYPLSKNLPAILSTMPSRNCFFAKRENYFVVEDAPSGFEYRVFFDVRNCGSRDAVLMFVQSAYPANREVAPGSKRRKVGFRVLINCALENRRVSEPP